MTRAALLVTLVTVAASTGCYRVTVVNGAVEPGRERSEWANSFLFGLVGDVQFDVRNECDGAAASVGRKEDLLTAFLSVVTVGIYTPSRVTVACDRLHDVEPRGASSAGFVEARAPESR